MQVGLISDTHGYFDPRLGSLLAGVEVILHAGDVGSRDVLNAIESITPVRAVRGNVDPVELGLPPSQTIRLEGMQMQMLHVLPAPPAQVEAWAKVNLPAEASGESQTRFLRGFEPATRMVIFGHTHTNRRF